MQNSSKLNVFMLIVILFLSIEVLVLENKNQNLLLSIIDQQTQSIKIPHKTVDTTIMPPAAVGTKGVQ